MADIQKEFEEARKRAEELEQQAKAERLALAKKEKEYAESVRAEAQKKLEGTSYKLELVKEGETTKATTTQKPRLTDEEKKAVAELVTKRRAEGKKKADIVRELVEQYHREEGTVYTWVSKTWPAEKREKKSK